MAQIKLEALFVIANAGYVKEIIDVARSLGARGGTVINARGSVSKEAEKRFNITIQEEKEIVLIVIPSTIKEKMLHALYKEVGTSTKAQGIVFSMPVDDAVGIKL